MTITTGNLFRLGAGIALSFLTCFVQTSNAHPAADSELQLATSDNKVSVHLEIPVDQLYTVAPKIFPQAKMVKTMTEALEIFSQVDRAIAQQYLFSHIKLTTTAQEQTSQWLPHLTATAVTQKGHDLMFVANLALVPPTEDTNLSTEQEFTLFYDGVMHQIKNHKVKVYQLEQASNNQKTKQKRIKTLRYNDTNLVLNND